MKVYLKPFGCQLFCTFVLLSICMLRRAKSNMDSSLSMHSCLGKEIVDFEGGISSMLSLITYFFWLKMNDK